jgi:hypothetical protein
MPDTESVPFNDRSRTPWNKGKLIGPKPPLRPKHVWSIRTRLMIEGRARDLAMFNLAIDSKLRGCDVVALKRSKTTCERQARSPASFYSRAAGKAATA